MRYETNHHDDRKGRVYIRQSWLNDLVTCPERARFKLVRPELSGPTDATIMGTAVHHAIEMHLNSSCDTGDMGDVAMTKFQELKTKPYKQTNLDPDKHETHIRSMCTAFIQDILPQVELGGETEYGFKVPTGIVVDGWGVWLEGTMDYVQPDGTVWDWKTASRAYNAREKQSTAIQATVYATALHKMALTEYPATFKYGVMIRGENPKGQVLSVSRNGAHENWLMNNIRSAVQMATRMGVVESNWTMNDTHFLCSERWCSYWSLCKGAYLSPSDMTVTPVDIPSTRE